MCACVRGSVRIFVRASMGAGICVREGNPRPGVGTETAYAAPRATALCWWRCGCVRRNAMCVRDVRGDKRISV